MRSPLVPFALFAVITIFGLSALGYQRDVARRELAAVRDSLMACDSLRYEAERDAYIPRLARAYHIPVTLGSEDHKMLVMYGMTHDSLDVAP